MTNAYISGQKVKDIDIVIFGNLSNCKVALKIDGHYKDVWVNSFVTCIEHKSHSIESIEMSGTNFYVCYSGAPRHSATNQSMNQRIALTNLISKQFVDTFVTNIIWFEQATRKEFISLIGNTLVTQTNVVVDDFDFSEFVEAILYQDDFDKSKNIRIDHFKTTDFTKDVLPNMLTNTFYTSQTIIGEYTRKKVESITNQVLQQEVTDDEIIRGKAGTGKTHLLLIRALKLSELEEKRVLLLTYNNVLANDLNRIFSFTRFKDSNNDYGFKITTIHKFIYSLCEAVGLLKDSSVDFIKEYSRLLADLVSLSEAGLLNQSEIRKEFSDRFYDLAWDYICIDEAQDCNELEMRLFMSLVGSVHVIVAEGSNQLIRNQRVDWTNKSTRKVKKLKISIRQKNNLVDFNNRIFEALGYDTDYKTDSKLKGGKVFIFESGKFPKLGFSKTNEILKSSGCVEYDLLFLVPPSLVDHELNMFIHTGYYTDNGLNIWDGTNEQIRNTPIQSNQSRVIQYDSCRGVEGWIVCYISIDKFYEYKWNSFKESMMDKDTIASFEEQRNIYVNTWMMIALTRAIDTMFITIEDPKSKIALILKNISNQCDFVEYIKL